MSDFDSPWKDILEAYFPEFLAFFFPDIFAAIDWARGYELLDKELHQVVREAELTRRTVDKLVRVWRRDGREEWVLIHVEVQTQDEVDFALRMYVYNYRLFDRFGRPVVSLAILGDDAPSWRPHQYRSDLWGCRLQFDFPIVKLLDYAGDLAALEANANPFATAVLAHLQTQRTRTAPQDRRAWKIRLMRGLYERGASRRDVHNLWRFIDWLMDLPPELEQLCWQELRQIEQEKQMPYMTSTERMLADKYRAEGRQESLHTAIAMTLEAKFGASGLALLPRVEAVTDPGQLQTLLRTVLGATDLAEVQTALD